MLFQLVCRPVATTRFSYEIMRPEVVVNDDDSGENVRTFSEICTRLSGMSSFRGLRVLIFSLSPAPTRVLQGTSYDLVLGTLSNERTIQANGRGQGLSQDNVKRYGKGANLVVVIFGCIKDSDIVVI